MIVCGVGVSGGGTCEEGMEGWSGADVGDGAGVYVMVVNEVVGFRSGWHGKE